MSSIKPPTPPLEVISVARSWIGTPYRHQSASRERGIDCVQFVIEVGREVGSCDAISLQPYRPLTNPNRIKERLSDHVVPLPKPTLGSVVFWGRRVGLPTHFGIFSQLDGLPSVIHADGAVGRVVEHNIPREQHVLLDSFWWFK